MIGHVLTPQAQGGATLDNENFPSEPVAPKELPTGPVGTRGSGGNRTRSKKREEATS